MNGTRSNHILRQALEVLTNLRHRGACGCDPESGDGAASPFKFPMSFWLEKCGEIGIDLPEAEQYGVGMVFLPPNPEHRQFCEQMLERIIAEEGQRCLGWRDVPVDSSAIGSVAHEAEPVIRQIFIAKSPFLDAQQFERKLYVIRRRATTTIEASVMVDVGFFYIVSLSCRTLIYKGMLMARQMSTFLPRSQ